MLWTIFDLIPLVSAVASSETAKAAERDRLKVILQQLLEGLEGLSPGSATYSRSRAQTLNGASDLFCHVRVCGHQKHSNTSQITLELERLLPQIQGGTIEPGKTALLQKMLKAEYSRMR